MPPNLQRFLPLILIVFLLLIVLPALTHKSSSSGPSASTLSTETIAATTIVDRTERAYRTAHHGYTSHVADLLALDHSLARSLGDGVTVQLDVSGDGQTYLAQVASSVIGLVRSRTGAKQIAYNCVIFKSGSGVECPAAAATATTTTTTIPTTTTTTTTTK